MSKVQEVTKENFEKRGLKKSNTSLGRFLGSLVYALPYDGSSFR